METFEEKAKGKSQKFKDGGSQNKPQKLSEVSIKDTKRITTQIPEFDRVLGGGIVPGAVILVAGDPGIGKSTLLLQVCQTLSGLYVSGEESVSQIKIRAERLGIKKTGMTILAEVDTDNICAQIEQEKPGFVVIDSIQTMETGDLSGMAGAVGQVRESASRFIRTAKDHTIPIIIVGHVTKEGAIAGPKVLEHLVDTVLYLEGERFITLRLLRVTKNRYGPVDEVGVFEMNDKGMFGVDNPSKLFLGEEDKKGPDVAPGCVITCTMEGTRPILAEIQALVVPSKLAMPRRVATGVDYNRLQMILAIIQKRLGLPLYECDVYINVAGGLKINEPSSDLAVAMAIISSFKNKPLSRRMCAVGELGLLGEIRRVGGLDKRTKEAKRLGYTQVASVNEFPTLVAVAKNF